MGNESEMMQNGDIERFANREPQIINACPTWKVVLVISILIAVTAVVLLVVARDAERMPFVAVGIAVAALIALYAWWSKTGDVTGDGGLMTVLSGHKAKTQDYITLTLDANQSFSLHRYLNDILDKTAPREDVVVDSGLPR